MTYVFRRYMRVTTRLETTSWICWNVVAGFCCAAGAEDMSTD